MSDKEQTARPTLRLAAAYKRCLLGKRESGPEREFIERHLFGGKPCRLAVGR